jgi:hypothetical protein
MATNSVENILAGAKKTLANANKFTESVEGNPTSRFGPKKPDAPKIPQAHQDTPYSMARQARADTAETGQAIKAKSDNIKEYTDASKQ